MVPRTAQSLGQRSGRHGLGDNLSRIQPLMAVKPEDFGQFGDRGFDA
jgi:hypothetical protein